MTRFFLGLLAAGLLFVAPAAHAQSPTCFGNASINCHFTGAGATSQFLSAALAADATAITVADLTSGQCPYHWTGKNGANAIDNRAGTAIAPELGNVWIVWVAACSDTTGNTNVTDIWTQVALDSTVGVRVFLATQTDGTPGAQIQIIPGASGGLVSPNSLWPDGKADVASISATSTVSVALGTSNSGGQHINAGVTDLRPEDALYATKRAYGTLNTSSWSGLGYKNVTNIGWPIYSNQGTGVSSQPVSFGLSGNDPISKKAVRAYSTVPLGAGAIIFAYNNDGAFDPNVLNLITGVGLSGTTNKLTAHLFDGTTSCNAANAAFGGTGSASKNITVVLREPLSGTENVTEFTVFRTSGNTDDSQEKGVTTPVQTSGPYNPLDLACTGSSGHRVRALSTGEVINAIIQKVSQPDPQVLGYIFWGFANASKLVGPHYQYLTLDGVDPIALSDKQSVIAGVAGSTVTLTTSGATNFPGSYAVNAPITVSGMSQANLNGTFTVASVSSDQITYSDAAAAGDGADNGDVNTIQQFPNCAGPCPSSLWQTNSNLGPTTLSFPHLRDGTYKAWSLLRWLVPNPDTDSYGPTALAEAAQNSETQSYADYVPFNAVGAPYGSDPGLNVYRSHFSQESVDPDNGGVSSSGLTLGGTSEAGGDVGGSIEGPFPYSASGTGKTTAGSATFSWVSGPLFIASDTSSGCVYTSPEVGQTITITGDPNSPFTINAVASSGKSATLSGPAGKTNHTASWSLGPVAVSTPGVLCKKQ